MPDAELLRLVNDRLSAEPPATDRAGEFVLAAFEGREQLVAALAGDAAPAAPQPRESGNGLRPNPAFLTGIAVEGFRGIGPPIRLEIAAGPGLTLVVGRNGSGKSSFAEALEMLLTGENRRWVQRSRVWTDGWRNLHHDNTSVGADVVIEGERKPRRLRRRWDADAELAAGRLEIDGKPATLDGLGWTRPLASYPPFLSHNELGRILDEGPTKLHDALAGILGLGEITQAQALIREQRIELEKSVKQAVAAAEQLRSRCSTLDDERALACVNALQGKQWDLAAIDVALGPTITAVEETSVLSQLRALSTLTQLDREAARALASQLRHAQTELDKVAKTDAALARDTVRLLEAATKVHTQQASSDCAVCGTQEVLTYEWRMQTAQRITDLRERAALADAVHRSASELRVAAQKLVSAPPAVLSAGPQLGVDTADAAAAWQRWAATPATTDLSALAAHLELGVSELMPAVAAARGAATTQLEKREDRWRPIADDLKVWRLFVDRVQAGSNSLAPLKAAEVWVKDAHEALRDGRFRPIAQAVQQNWSTLRQDSNVTLGRLRLEGSTTQRRLTLDVSVDSENASALGVMSQGELNCLALSLFLPRASMPESPFRFLVIDDPVQAMDPAKVEGLARVFQRAATDRQVIVLTHDDRLPDAVRRLEIPATIIEVSRRPHSVVELRSITDPVAGYIEDALAVAQTKGLPSQAVRVVPGFCRSAIEAACAQAITRRLLGEGDAHADVEAALQIPTTLNMWLALWLHRNPARGGDVMAGLTNRGLGWATDAVAACNRGSHSGSAVALMPLIRDVERLCHHIAATARVG